MGLHQSHTAHGFPRCVCGKTSGPTGKQCKSLSLDGKATIFKGLGKNKSSINPSISSRRRQCCLVTRPKGRFEEKKNTGLRIEQQSTWPISFQRSWAAISDAYKYGGIPQSPLVLSSSKAALYHGPLLYAATTGIHQNPATMTGHLAPPYITPKCWWQKSTVQCL